MKQLFLFTICCAMMIAVHAQTIKLDYFSKVPAKISNCGAQYTYDTISLKKKNYILLVDFQDIGLISVAGKTVSLTLMNTKLSDKTISVSTYKGSGYTVTLAVKTGETLGKADLEDGTLEVSRGNAHLSLKIHGQSSCGGSKQEKNR